MSVIVPDNAISKTKCATRTRPRTNLSRTPKIHQNSDFLGKLIIFQGKCSYVIASVNKGKPYYSRSDIRTVSFNRLNKKRTRGFGYVFYVLSLLFENRLQGDYGVAVAAVRSKSQVLFGKGDIFVHAETVEVAHADVVLRDRQVLLCRLHII